MQTGADRQLNEEGRLDMRGKRGWSRSALNTNGVDRRRSILIRHQNERRVSRMMQVRLIMTARFLLSLPDRQFYMVDQQRIVNREC